MPISLTICAPAGAVLVRVQTTTSSLSQGQRICDRNIGRQRMKDRAVLLQGHIYCSASLGRVDLLATEPVVQVNGHIAAGFLFPSGAGDLDSKLLKADSHLLQDRYDIGAGAGRSRKQQGQHRPRTLLIVAIERDAGTSGLSTDKVKPLLPRQGNVLGLARHPSVLLCARHEGPPGS